jgi:hypothetical protein
MKVVEIILVEYNPVDLGLRLAALNDGKAG